MQISLILLEQITQLFLILIMGYILVKSGMVKSSDSKIVSVIVVYLATPCIIINSFQVDYTPQVRTGLIYAFAVAAAVHLLFLLFTFLIRKPLRLDCIEQATLIYTNAGILVIPLVNALLGSDYVVYSCAFIVVQVILLWTHGCALVSGQTKPDWKKVLLNVNILSIFVGALLFLLRIPLPKVISGTLETCGSLLGPLGMLLAGMVIADAPLKDLFTKKRNYLPTAIRLLVYPLLLLLLFKTTGIARLIPDGKNLLMIVYLASVTPVCAALTSIAQFYDQDAFHASSLYVLSTICSIATIPVMIGLFDVLI